MNRLLALLISLILAVPAFAQGIIAKDESTAGARIITLRSVSTSTGIPAAPGSLSAGDLKISKAGGAEANTAGTFTSLGNGECTYQATAGEVDTVGVVTVRLLKTGYTGLGSALVTSGIYADVRQINGGSTSGNNATLKLAALDIHNTSGTAFNVQSDSGVGFNVQAGGPYTAIVLHGGNGTSGVHNTAGSGIDIYGGNSATTDPPSGDPPDGGKWGAAAMRLYMNDGPGITFYGRRGRANYDYAIGMLDFGDGSGNHWAGNFLNVSSSGSGAFFGPNSPLAWNNSITGNITGNLSGSVGSVTGNVNGYVAQSIIGSGLTAVGSTDTSVKLGATGSTQSSAYVGDQLTLTQIGVSRTIVSYDENTQTATVDTAFPAEVPDGLNWSIFPGRAKLAATTHTSATIPAVSITGSVSGNIGGNLGGNVLGNVNGNLAGNVGGNIAGSVVTGVPDSSGTTTLLSRLTSTRAGYLDLLPTINAANDPWSVELPGAYASGTAGKLLGSMGSASVTFVNPLSLNGTTVQVVRGDDYAAADGKALEWTQGTASWPTLTGASVLFSMRTTQNTVFTKAGSVVTATGSSKKVRVELTAAETAAFPIETLPFDVQVTLSSGGIQTLVNGKVKVIEDVR